MGLWAQGLGRSLRGKSLPVPPSSQKESKQELWDGNHTDPMDESRGLVSWKYARTSSRCSWREVD